MAYSFLDVLRALQCSYCAYISTYTYNMCIYIYLYIYIHDYTYLDISLPFFSSYPSFFQLQLPSKKTWFVECSAQSCTFCLRTLLTYFSKILLEHSYFFLTREERNERVFVGSNDALPPVPPPLVHEFLCWNTTRKDTHTYTHVRIYIAVVGAARLPLWTTEP